MKIHQLSLKKINLKLSSVECQPFYFSLNVLIFCTPCVLVCFPPWCQQPPDLPMQLCWCIITQYWSPPLLYNNDLLWHTQTCHSWGLGTNRLGSDVRSYAWRALNFNALRPRQNGRRFTDDTFKRIFLNENVIILIKISLKFVPKGPITIVQHWFR